MDENSHRIEDCVDSWTSVHDMKHDASDGYQTDALKGPFRTEVCRLRMTEDQPRHPTNPRLGSGRGESQAYHDASC